MIKVPIKGSDRVLFPLVKNKIKSLLLFNLTIPLKKYLDICDLPELSKGTVW